MMGQKIQAANQVKWVNFPKIGSPDEGFLSVGGDPELLGFRVCRAFWTYGTPSSLSRGRHAHYETEMVLVAIAGQVVVKTETVDGCKDRFVLDDPSLGLFLPKLCWHEMTYSTDAVQLVLCSTDYDESDYIRSRSMFDRLVKEAADE